MFYSFNCTCGAPTAYIIDATETVLCGVCHSFGTAVLLTSQQVSDLDLPQPSGSID
jgi:hypothetical protein